MASHQAALGLYESSGQSTGKGKRSSLGKRAPAEVVSPGDGFPLTHKLWADGRSRRKGKEKKKNRSHFGCCEHHGV